VIPGAAVTLLNVKTGAQTVRESNNAGFYIIDRVDPGAYTLTVEAQGFSKFVQENITVQMQADITVNARLKIGAINETVTVTESPVAVAFNSTSIGMTLDDQLTTELPTTHRNPFKLAYLNPAVRETWSDNKTVPWESPAANNLDLGGNTSKRNELKVDGSTVAVGDRASYVPNADSVQEVNIQQNAVDAEIGHSAGGSVAMTLKSGSNDWHGTASFMYRNPSWNATADRTTRTAAGNMSKIGAATLGNPIIKNKLFNFFSFEQWWQRTPSSFFMTLPTDLERQGDFSKSLTNKGALKVIYDPYSTVVSSAGVTRTPFPDN
jgi:hypothetical protein